MMEAKKALTGAEYEFERCMKESAEEAGHQAEEAKEA